MPEAQVDPTTAEDVFGFIHVATHGRWKEVLDEQLALIRSSGLYARSTRIFISVVGPQCEDLSLRDEKIEVAYRSPELGEFEYPTLGLLHHVCRSRRCSVYYLHTKGIFRDTEPTEDWRRYMQHFVVTRHADCEAALRTHDTCGVNWQTTPWPHHSGNFWWARSEYVAGLAPPRRPESGSMDARHRCEAWIGSDARVHPASLHQSRVNHYESRYAPERYASPDQASSSSGPSVTGAGASEAPFARRVAMIFDDTLRPDTTGVYCLRAMRRLAHVSHFLPAELDLVPEHAFDLFLFIDDGVEYQPPRRLRPSAFWAIDTHLRPAELVRFASAVDFAFAAQPDGVELFRQHGIDCPGWLPLACDPDVHRKHDVAKELDVCFVGHLNTLGRRDLDQFVRHEYPRSFVGQQFFDDMARTYSRTRVVLNLGVRNDINMRVFEALSCGSMLLTNDLNEDGLAKLFTDGEHLVTYRDPADLKRKIDHYLRNPVERERIAAAGRERVLSFHTYLHRMRTILDIVPRYVGEPPLMSAAEPSQCADRDALTSIVIPVLNQIDFTRRCIDSIRANTASAYEIIVVDNGSIDGTVEYLRDCPHVRLIENADNRGFAAAVNQGLAVSSGRQLLLLNNDTVVTPGWLDRMIAALHRDPAVGMVGPCSNNVPGAQRVTQGYAELSDLDRFSIEHADRNCGRIEPAELLVGFCLLLRREVLERVGPLDESFGIGTYEDYEYCRRASRAGYRIVIARDAYVHHFGSVTFAALGIDVHRLLAHNEQIFRSRCGDEMSAAPAPVCRPEPVPVVSIVIVTFNVLEFTKLCLESLDRWTQEPAEIIVVDNASSDGTREYLRSHPSLILIENDVNRGFPVAANQGLARCRGRDLLLLNNDVVVTPEWLLRLRNALYSSGDVGLVGPCTNDVSGPQKVPVDYRDAADAAGFSERWFACNAGCWEETERLVGFCLMFRREVLEKVGFLDERFGIGNFEDDDFCRRARIAGFRAVIARDCFVHHFGSATFKASGVDYAAVLAHNERLYLEKWGGGASRRLPSPSAPLQLPLQFPPPQEREAVPRDGASNHAAGTVSLCMIVRDSSRTLRQCLESARPWVDEIIVVDTGSVDDTAAIASELGAHVHSFPWCDDFAAARNESMKEATCDWVFWMDSDDTIDEANGRKLRELVRTAHRPATMGFVIQVHCPAPGPAGAYATKTVVDHVKLFRNRCGFRFSGRIHEQVLPSIRQAGGDVAWTDVFVDHSGSDVTEEGRARKHVRDLRLLQLELDERPDDTFALFNLGMTLLDMRRPEEALDALSRSLQMAVPGESHLRKIYALLVQAYCDLGRRGTALRTCVQGLELFPEDPELLFRRAVVEQAEGRLAEAEQALRAVVKPRPDRHFASLDSGILGLKAWHNLAVVCERQSKFADAAEAWGKTLAFDGANRVAWRGLIDALSAGNDVARLGALAQLDPPEIPDDLRRIATARLSAKRGDVGGAVEHLEVVADERASAELLGELAELAFRCHMWDSAVRALRRLADLLPGDACTQRNLAAAYFNCGDRENAQRSALRARELDPDRAEEPELAVVG